MTGIAVINHQYTMTVGKSLTAAWREAFFSVFAIDIGHRDRRKSITITSIRRRHSASHKALQKPAMADRPLR
jgi:hypothetical protein